MKEGSGDNLAIEGYDIPVMHDYVEKLCRSLPTLGKGSPLAKFAAPEDNRPEDRSVGSFQKIFGGVFSIFVIFFFSQKSQQSKSNWRRRIGPHVAADGNGSTLRTFVLSLNVWDRLKQFQTQIIHARYLLRSLRPTIQQSNGISPLHYSIIPNKWKFIFQTHFSFIPSILLSFINQYQFFFSVHEFSKLLWKF